MNHPVHFVINSNVVKTSSSAFIPFCEFGGNMSSVGVKIDQFNFPICNSFQAKILNDQLCYEIDLKQHVNKYNINEELTSGGLSGLEESQDHEHQAVIYLDTIGMYKTRALFG